MSQPIAPSDREPIANAPGMTPNHNWYAFFVDVQRQLEDLSAENTALAARVTTLEATVADHETRIAALEAA